MIVKPEGCPTQFDTSATPFVPKIHHLDLRGTPIRDNIGYPEELSTPLTPRKIPNPTFAPNTVALKRHYHTFTGDTYLQLMDGNGKAILQSDSTPILTDQATKLYQAEYDSKTMSTPIPEFKGPADDRASP